MAMDLKAFDTGTDYLFRAHLDTTKTIRDPALPVPAEGQPDTRPLVPDPDWVLDLTWGKVLPAGQTVNAFLANCKAEAGRLAELDPRIQPAPTEISLPI